MAYRFTNTDKWGDSWYSKLPVLSKLLFNFLCDKCDIAGFIEYTPNIWAAEIGCTNEEVESSCKLLSKGIVFSIDESCLFIRNYVKHQKNLPLNISNKAHIGILKRIELYCKKFGFETVNSFIDELIQRGFEGASKGLPSPTGTGTGIGIDNGRIKEEEKEEIFPVKSEEEKQAEINRAKFEKFKTYLNKEPVKMSLSTILGCDNVVLEKLIKYFLLVRGEEMASNKNTEFEAKTFFVSWVKYKDNRDVALKDYDRILRIKLSKQQTNS